MKLWTNPLTGLTVVAVALASEIAVAQVESEPPTDAPPAAEQPADVDPGPPPLSETLTGQAKTDYESGKLLFGEGDFNGATLKFRRAYEVSKDARLLWNIAACEKQLRHYSKVELLVGQYLVEGGAQLSEADKDDARALLEIVRAFIGNVRVSANVAGADVYVDDAHMGSTPLPKPLRVDMGERRVVVSKDGYKEWTATRTVVGKETLDLTATLELLVHQGTLRVTTDPNATVRVDGRLVGVGPWQGTVESGTHSVEVSAPGKIDYRTDVVIKDDAVSTLRVTLDDERPAVAPSDGGMPWLWIAGGTVLAAGLGVGGYFLFRPEDKGPPPIVDGSLGTVELPLRF